MKTNSTQYAELLYEITDKEDESQVSEAIKGFAKFLVNNNDSFKIDKIIKKFQEIWNEKNGVVEAKIESASKLDESIKQMLNEYILELSQAKKVVIEEKTDKELLGGVVIRYKDKILDGSLRTRLTELNHKMTK
jgi:F-type H+-transporting ATPase subunit delta